MLKLSLSTKTVKCSTSPLLQTQGKVLRTLMDSVAFMKNLPESVVLPRAATPIVDSPAVSDLPPSSPMQWGLSQPRHEVLQPLPPRSRSHSRYRPVPVPAKVHRHRPTEAFVQHKSRCGSKN